MIIMKFQKAIKVNKGYFQNISIVLIAFLMSISSSSFAQKKLQKVLVSKNVFNWNQDEKVYGFSHFDQFFKVNDIVSGNKIHILESGSTIAAFNIGGNKEKEFNSYLINQKVAGLLVLHQGKIRVEHYALGFSANDRWTSQSIAKSVTSTLVGVAIKDGYIKSIEEPIISYLPELKGSAYEKVSIQHLLTMTSGVKWNENYADSSSDIVNFYTHKIEPGFNETISYMRKLSSIAVPGKKWNYNTGESHLLGLLVTKATKQSLSKYFSDKIWIPYGMEDKATWNIGRSDQEFAGCCIQMKLRDVGRFGQFILDGAKINGKSIVPDGWIQSATKPHILLWPGWGYGYQWWSLGDGTFRALGIYGQLIHIDPVRDLVVVLNSVWPEADNFNRQVAVDSFIKLLNSEIDKK